MTTLELLDINVLTSTIITLLGVWLVTSDSPYTATFNKLGRILTNIGLIYLGSVLLATIAIGLMAVFNEILTYL